MQRAIRYIAIAGLLFVILSCSHERPSSLEGVVFLQTQSSTTILGDKLLIVSNLSGKMRPYLVQRSGWEPLLKDTPENEVSDLDFFRPLALDQNTVLFSVQDSGREPFEIYRFDRETNQLKNLTRTPHVDEGDICTSEGKDVVSFRAGDQQVVRSLTDWSSLPVETKSSHGFMRCMWKNQNLLLGVSKKPTPNAQGAYTLSVCRRLKDRFLCSETEALNTVRHFVDFERIGENVGFFGLTPEFPFRQLYELDESFQSITIASGFPKNGGDVLESAGPFLRMGSGSRYTLIAREQSAFPEQESLREVVFSSQQVGGETWGIVAAPNSPRLPALYSEHKWLQILPESLRPPRNTPSIEEVWIQSPSSGERFQLWWFGPGSRKNIVVWLHGGPRENVSPRYNPYFHMLNNLGFAVVALNYPGSTGRGLSFESKFERDALVDSLRTLSVYLRENRHSSHVVLWTISTGFSLARLWAQEGLPLSAHVSQAAAAQRPLRQKLRAAFTVREIPVFSIRGMNDRFPGGEVEFEYEGGHDIIDPHQFTEMTSKIAPFLEGVASRPPATIE
ncbi:MAG: hypothetical protein KDD64_09300 [Bdellovibrionales bacterium]|nr:hypothetical protein [Bdellovibrionales bacterium]